VRARALPEGDRYRIHGTKIFITYGEHDLTENIVHLVLARLPDAPKGVKGISLFLVPKYLVNEDGSLGARNEVQCLSLEHKLGIHGSPTAVMSFGQNKGAIGYLIGKLHEGLSCMFTMMNHARLNVGLQGVAIADRALQQALWYAFDRVQGKTLIQSEHSPAPIAFHPDVRRMLSSMQCRTQAMRALAYEAAAQLDIASHHPDPSIAHQAQSRVDLLIPVVKGWCTEQSIDIASLGVQVHGGMGFIEDTGAAQFLRDVRVTTIYEGTNGIQAMDLVGRKMADGGAAIHALIDALEHEARGDAMGAPLAAMAGDLRAATGAMLAMGQNDRFGGAVPYLMGFARVLGGLYHLRAARSGEGPRIALARVYLDRLLPEAAGLFAQARHGAAGLYDLSPEDLGA
jgi:alkylation response protein AidB-like acyl-CoA dehydrogenase